jgi:ribosomal protein L16/L10AE
MQQQLGGGFGDQIGGLTLGAVDLSNQEGHQLNQQQLEQAQTMLMHMQHMNDVNSSGQKINFIPHKNLMPKTTGSQAHLLNIQEANNLKQYNSLNHTGRLQGERVKNGKKGNTKQNN